MSNKCRNGKEYAKVFRVIPNTAILGEFLRAWMCLACFTCRHLLTDHHPENEIEATSCFSKQYSFFTISDRSRGTYFLAYLLFSRLSSASTFCNSYSEFLKFFERTKGLTENVRIFPSTFNRYRYDRFLESFSGNCAFSRYSAYVARTTIFADMAVSEQAKTSQKISGTALIHFVANKDKKCFYFGFFLLLLSICFTVFSNCIAKVLNFGCRFFNSLYKPFPFIIAFLSNQKANGRNNARNEGAQEKHDVSTAFVSINISQQAKNRKNSQAKNYVKNYTSNFFGTKHFLPLRGLISNLWSKTKFYSSFRRDLNNYRRLA